MNRRGFFGTLAAIAGAAKAAPAVEVRVPKLAKGTLTRLEENTRNLDAAAIEWLRDKCLKAELVEVDALFKILEKTSVRLKWMKADVPNFLTIHGDPSPYKEFIPILQNREMLICFPGPAQWEFRITTVGESGCYVRSCDMTFQSS